MKIEIIDSSAQKERTTKTVERWYTTYGPFWHLYVDHYDQQKYKERMDNYKKRELKYRPNGRVTHKVRYNRANGEDRSDLEILMAKYNFTLQDLRDEVRDRRKELRSKQGIL